MSTIYCGNNRYDSSLINGRKRIGSRYECLKKGIGIGLSMPVDLSYLDRYRAIDTRKMYCGTQLELPEGYDYMGTTTACLQHGVGVGRKIKAERSSQGSRRRNSRASRKKRRSNSRKTRKRRKSK